jgi:pimeloyl-ACP methyl ester carboxylesterase
MLHSTPVGEALTLTCVTLRASTRLRLFGAVVVAASVVLATGIILELRTPTAGSHGSHEVMSTVARTGSMHTHFRLASGDGATFVPNAYNYASRTVTNGPLLLFLAATGLHPSNYQQFLSTARADGYHVLALDYWNTGQSVQKTCGTNGECYTQVQRNRLDGSQPNQFSAVSRGNSIVVRLRAAISHLEASDPSGEWSRYLDPHGVDWENIVVAGHSQGGGESAYIAHVHLVRGVLMFSSPVDSDHGVEASWMRTAGATPASRMYGFDDSRDTFYTRIVASWDALGMPSSHQLISHRVLGGPGLSHLKTITDATPHTKNGSSVFAGVWRQMLAHFASP